MKLELKHLAGYLPYKLKCVDLVDNINFQLDTLNIDNVVSDATYLNTIRPILHPLSDLTKEIEVNGEKFTTLDYISTSTKDSQQNIRYLFKGFYDDLSHWKIQRLLELHFDIYGLIENGLAIDINTLNENSK